MTTEPETFGARCGVHPDEPAVGACTRCGTFACASCAREGERGVFMCAVCEPYAGESIPWERRKELGLVSAFIETTKLAVLSPSKFYAIPPREHSALPAMGYGLVFVVVTGFLSLVISLTVGRGNLDEQLAQARPMLEQQFPSIAANLDALYSGALIVGFIASPLQLVINLYSGAVLTWLGLKLTGAMRSSFSRIVRGLAYMTWINVFSVLLQIPQPIVQIAIGFGMLGVTSAHWVIMVRESQRITTGEAMLSSVVSTAVALGLCCIFFVIPVIAVVVAAASSLAGH